MTSVEHVKVRAEHQQRLAFVYVRQSSPRQVRNHLESQGLQYGLADQAAALGWTRDSRAAPAIRAVGATRRA